MDLKIILVMSAFALALASPLESRQSLSTSPWSEAHRIYYIFNNCPTDINLVESGVFSGEVIPIRNFTTKYTTSYGWRGPFYTDANGGNVDGSGSAKALFWNNVRVTLKIHSLLTTGL